MLEITEILGGVNGRCWAEPTYEEKMRVPTCATGHTQVELLAHSLKIILPPPLDSCTFMHLIYLFPCWVIFTLLSRLLNVSKKNFCKKNVSEITSQYQTVLTKTPSSFNSNEHDISTAHKK